MHHNNTTEQCGSSTVRRSSGTAARCRSGLLGSEGEGVQHPCLPLRLTVPSADAEWEVFSRLVVIRKLHVTLNTWPRSSYESKERSRITVLFIMVYLTTLSSAEIKYIVGGRLNDG